MHVAVSSGDPARVRELLLARPDAVHDRTRLGETPLHIAVARAPREVVQMLCASGADPNARKNVRFGRRHMACAAAPPLAAALPAPLRAPSHTPATGAGPWRTSPPIPRRLAAHRCTRQPGWGATPLWAFCSGSAPTFTPSIR